MTDDAWKLPARYAVQQLARRCKEHPQIEADPVCVIATECERMLDEIDRSEVPAEQPKPVVAVKDVRQRRRGRVVA